MESRDNNKTDALLDVEVVPKPVTDFEGKTEGDRKKRTNKNRKSHRHTSEKKSHSQREKKSKNDFNSKHNIVCIWLIAIVSLIAVCALVFVLYKNLTKNTCNLFGVSVARTPEELTHLATCKRLVDLTIDTVDTTTWESLDIPNDTFNNVEKLLILGHSLKSISIGDRCFASLTSFLRSENTNLLSFVVGSNSFPLIPDFTINSTDSFERIEIGKNSFLRSDLAIATPSFTSLVIGDNSFRYASKVVFENGAQSIHIGNSCFQEVKSVTMSLSSTTSLYFGEYAFASAPQFEVTDSSSLESIEFSAHAFETGADFSSMLNSQHLHSIEFRGYNYLNATAAQFHNMPQLSYLFIEFTSLTQIQDLSFSNLNLTEYVITSERFPSLVSVEYSNDSVLSRFVVLPSALPNLHKLTLSHLSALTEFMAKQNSLPLVSSFTTEDMAILQSITIEKGAMERLSSLEIQNFPRLEIVNIHEATFPDLQSIQVTNTSNLKYFLVNSEIGSTPSVSLQNLPHVGSVQFTGEIGTDILTVELVNVNASRLVIGQENIPGTFQNVLTFTLSGMDGLNSLIVGDSCFQNIRSMSFPVLNEVVIGSDSFKKVSDVVLKGILNRVQIGSRSFIESKQLLIDNTPSYAPLSVYISDESFSSATKFILSHGESLSSLQLGNNTFSVCEDFSITNPTSIQSVVIGDNVGGITTTFTLNGVKRFIVGSNSFSDVTSFSLGDSIISSLSYLKVHC